MFETAPFVTNIGYFVFALVGALVGVFSGVVVSVILKLRIRGIVKDAVLGAAGFLVVWFIITMSRFHYPFSVAAVSSAILPAFHQLARSKRT